MYSRVVYVTWATQVRLFGRPTFSSSSPFCRLVLWTRGGRSQSLVLEKSLAGRAEDSQRAASGAEG